VQPGPHKFTGNSFLRNEILWFDLCANKKCLILALFVSVTTKYKPFFIGMDGVVYKCFIKRVHSRLYPFQATLHFSTRGEVASCLPFSMYTLFDNHNNPVDYQGS
jgi:hypothetical protein